MTFLIRSLATDYSAGTVIDRHDHGWRQIVFAEAGVMRILAGRDEYFAPPSMAVSVPAGVDHEIRMENAVRMRTLYINPAFDAPEDGPRVLAISPFFRELIRRIIEIGMLRAEDEVHAAFAAVLMSEVRGAATLPLTLRRPSDPRAARAADLAGGDATLADIGVRAGASARTLQRLFLEETGLGFAQWRTQRRLLAAAQALSAGASVARAAEAAGYESLSAFVAAFRRQFGAPPGKWSAARLSGG